MNMFAFAECDESRDRVCMDWTVKGYQYLPGVSMLGSLFVGVGEDFMVEELRIAPAPLLGAEDAFDAARLKPDWRETVVASECRFFPPSTSPPVAPVESPGLQELWAPLKRLDPPKQRSPRKDRERAISKAPKMKGSLPDAMKAECDALPKGYEDDCDLDSLASVSPGSSDDGGDALPSCVDPMLAALGLHPGAEDIKLDSETAAHEHRAIPFGPWPISPIVSKGTVIGWGGNCGCHYSADTKVACKKAITATRTSDVNECRLLAKAWLLEGATIPAGSPTGRRDHIFGVPRSSLVVRDESELDAEAATYL